MLYNDYFLSMSKGNYNFRFNTYAYSNFHSLLIFLLSMLCVFQQIFVIFVFAMRSLQMRV